MGTSDQREQGYKNHKLTAFVEANGSRGSMSIMHFGLLPFSPRLIQALWECGKLPSEDIPKLAQDALELGFDGKHTRQLAGLIRPDRFDLLPHMSTFFTELGIDTQLSRKEAPLTLARLIAQAIADGHIAPYRGARFIWREIVNELWPNPPQELLSFIGNAAEYEDCNFYSEHPEEVRRNIEKHIIEDARSLVAQ